MILFAQATFNANAGYRPVYTIFLFTLRDSLWNELPFYIQSFTLGWIIPAMQSLQKRVAARLEIICRFARYSGRV